MKERSCGKNSEKAATGFAASYTIEMAYVMAFFCTMMVALVLQAYRIHDETKSAMNLQEAVELKRHEEDGEEGEGEITEAVLRRRGLLLSLQNLSLSLSDSWGKTVGEASGEGRYGEWKLSISSPDYKPEDFLRKVAALKQLEGRNENQLQEGDTP